MKIVVFGATGGTGRSLVEQALRAGHDVVAFVRRPAALDGVRSRSLGVPAKLEVVQGDVLDPAAVREAVGRGEVVGSCLGASSRTPTTVCSQGIRNIVDAMRALERRRLVCESAYGAAETRRSGPYTYMLRILIPAIMEDKDRMEEIVRASGLEFVIVRPGSLTNGPLTRHYRDGPYLEQGWFPRISRADVAHFMLRQLEEQEYAGLAVTIGY